MFLRELSSLKYKLNLDWITDGPVDLHKLHSNPKALLPASKKPTLTERVTREVEAFVTLHGLKNKIEYEVDSNERYKFGHPTVAFFGTKRELYQLYHLYLGKKRLNTFDDDDFNQNLTIA